METDAVRPRNVTPEQFKAMQASVARGKHGSSVGINSEVAPRHQSVAPTGGPRFKSKWESAYSAKLDLELRAGLIKAYWYEPFSLWLPGKVRYKPDFMVQYKVPLYQVNITDYVPQLEIIEVKGFSRNRRDGITRLKIAAALFPCFVWRMVWRTKGGGWDGMYVGQ
jgi:hypothetical protein